MAKRLLDVTCSSIGFLLIFPIFFVLALLVKFTSKGPVFFIQRRIGILKQPFHIYKFRTMYDRDPAKIDQMKEAVVSSSNDVRITAIGRFLRKTSLDELPQLINIIKGDMSIVGPRPIIPEQLLAIRPEFDDRFLVKPGLTGLAQIKGRRNLGWLDQLAYDNEYARRHSFFMDIKIVFKTLGVLLKSEAIYGSTGQNWRAYVNSDSK